MALATKNPSLYAELAQGLRDRRLPSVSLLPGERVPAHVAVVLTSPEEVRLVAHPNVVPVREEGERAALWAAVEEALGARPADGELVVGIDPGPRPGYAVLSGGRPLVEGVLESPEAVARLGSQLRRRFHSRAMRFRVGSGDRIARDRILNALQSLGRPVEVVDEEGTTPRGARRPRDALAARAIASGSGRLVRGRTPLHVTSGEIANLQRVSREGSGGRFTLPRAEAGRILRGEVTLTEAIAAAEQRYRAHAADRRRAGGSASERS